MIGPWTLSPFEMFVLTWASAMAGACLSEWFRRVFESRRRKPRYGRMTSEWQYRTVVKRGGR